MKEEGKRSLLRDEVLLHKTSQADADKTLAACGRAGGGMSQGVRLPLSLGRRAGERFPTSNLEAQLQLHWHCVGGRAVASSHLNDVLL